MSAKLSNLHPHEEHRLRHILQWKLGLRRELTPPFSKKWEQATDLEAIHTNPEMIANASVRAVQVTWIGHASFLVQMAGSSYLFDPVFGSHCSPIPLPGLKRLHPPALALQDLPSLDGIFISHNHYDHFEKRTIMTLGRSVPCYVPLGLGKMLNKMKVSPYSEFNWWESKRINDMLTVHCVPAQHFSSRGLHDRNCTLWCGWVLEFEGNMRLYFVGDTGYSPVFHEIRERVGTMGISIIPIGAYRPRSVMRSVHVDPQEAVMIHQDVQSQQSIASHWGTFRLTDEPIAEPPALLRKALSEEGIDAEAFRILQIGETISFPISSFTS